jgi:2-amino-4-hydroxy-6-hydroxymethyldihydropteridine diphosphokinase
VALGLGGNLGDPLYWFRVAADVFSRHLHAIETAALYRTAAVSPIPQPPYLNTVLAGVTASPPEDLLAIAKALELAAGRRAGPRHAARPLDIDLLVHGDQVRSTPELVLPHPRLRARRFALEPLADLDPRWRLPPDGRSAGELLAALGRDQDDVVRLGRWDERREER